MIMLVGMISGCLNNSTKPSITTTDIETNNHSDKNIFDPTGKTIYYGFAMFVLKNNEIQKQSVGIRLDEPRIVNFVYEKRGSMYYLELYGSDKLNIDNIMAWFVVPYYIEGGTVTCGSLVQYGDVGKYFKSFDEHANYCN